MGKYFGTDGIRGKVGRFPLTTGFFYRLAIAAGRVLSNSKKITNIFIGKDTRNSSDMIQFALSAGFSAIGLNITDLGVVTTPAIAHIIRGNTGSVGVMISASHNPYMDNGIKFFNSEGFKLSDSIETEIEEMVDNQEFFKAIDHLLEKEESLRFGNSLNSEGFLDKYLDHLLKVFKSLSKKKYPTDIKLYLDCANGSCSSIAGKLFNQLGFKTQVYNNYWDGFNINENCGATNPQGLSAILKKNGDGIGFCFDGDADRLIAIDEDGQIVSGDEIMVICANFFKRNNCLKNNKIVVTVMSNLGLIKALKSSNIEIEVTGVGDRYVLETMLEKDISLGGEQSGHIIFKDFATTGDGLLSSLVLLAIIIEEGKALKELKKQMNIFPQVLKNIRIREEKKKQWQENKKIKDIIQKHTEYLGEDGRILVRASGTEPMIRVMAEGQNPLELENIVNSIIKTIHEELV
ncbi:phosphoglucosamine mutase [Candidatus Riflebacteria bacterium]